MHYIISNYCYIKRLFFDVSLILATIIGFISITMKTPGGRRKYKMAIDMFKKIISIRYCFFLFCVRNSLTGKIQFYLKNKIRKEKNTIFIVTISKIK